MTDEKAEKPWHEGLTDKERRFVEEYLVDLNGTEAAIRAGYTQKNRASASVMACRLLAKPTLRLAVTALFEKAGISKIRILEEQAKIAFANIDDYAKIVHGKVVITNSKSLSREQLAAVAEISETITEFGTAIKVKPYDKQAALAFLGKVARLTVERHEVSGPNGGPIEATVEDVRARVAERLAKIAKSLAAEDKPASGEGA